MKFGDDVLDEAWRERMTTRLRWLGRQTSLPRDLDVQRLGFAELAGHVRDPAALAPFAELLDEEREEAHELLAGALRSDRTTALLTEWQTVGIEPKGGGRPVDAVAGEVLERAARRIRRRGVLLTEDATDAVLHDLRKRAKEMRYLLDMFMGLGADGAAARTRSATKKLQQALGRHQDAVAQAGFVADHTRVLRAGAALPGRTRGHARSHGRARGAPVPGRGRRPGGCCPTMDPVGAAPR